MHLEVLKIQNQDPGEAVNPDQSYIYELEQTRLLQSLRRLVSLKKL